MVMHGLGNFKNKLFTLKFAITQGKN